MRLWRRSTGPAFCRFCRFCCNCITDIPGATVWPLRWGQAGSPSVPCVPDHLPPCLCRFALQDGVSAGVSSASVAAYEVQVFADAPSSAVDCLPQGGSGLSSHSPYLATVSAVRELHAGGDRSCVHVELDISGCQATYEAGGLGRRCGLCVWVGGAASSVGGRVGVLLGNSVS